MKGKITFLILTLFIIASTEIRAQCSGVDFEEKNGIAVLEMEKKITSSWKRETAVSNFTGSSYIAWRGSNYFNSPGIGVINYKIRINSPGIYRFQWRNKVGIGSNSTEHNDSWLRIPDSYDFYGQNGSSVKYPNGGKFRRSNRVMNGSSANGWMKIYTNGSASQFNWRTFASDHDAHKIYAEFRSAGIYTIQVSGRSNGHFIDRMVLYKESSYSESSATNVSRGTTTCGGSSSGDTGGNTGGSNTAPTVNITNPNNGQNFNVGSNVTVNLSANDADGNIIRHEIFVNGGKVDTDGTSYSPQVIRNVTAGNYTVKAVVTDSNGEKGEDTVSFTVGGSTGGDTGGNTGGNTGGDTNNGGGQSPTVTITSPTNGQSVSVGANLSVKLNANDPDGSIVKYQVYYDGNLVDTDGAGYTPHLIRSVTAGSHTVRVVVTDNSGKTGEDTASFTAGGNSGGDTGGNTGGNTGGGDGQTPTVSITKPSNGQNFATGSNVSVNVSANDPDGSITKYQVFVNNKLVDTDEAGYTPHVIRNVAAGSYTVKVIVTDNSGKTGEDTVTFTAGGSTGGNTGGDTGGNTGGNDNSGQISFTLVNSTSNGDIDTLKSGTQVAKSNSSNINIRANVSVSGAKSVALRLSGSASAFRVENVAPYALWGDVGGNYLNGSLPSGNFTLVADVFSAAGGKGTKLASSTINFVVLSNAIAKEALNKTVVYENPIRSSRINLKLPAEMDGTLTYSIINPSGLLIDKGETVIEKSAAPSRLSIDASRLRNPGIYFVIIDSGASRKSLSVIKN